MASYDAATRYRVKVKRVVRLADRVTVLRPDHHQIVAYGDVVSQINPDDLLSAEPLPATPEPVTVDVKAAVQGAQEAKSSARASRSAASKA